MKKMKNIIGKSFKKQDGFSLLEMLLTVGVFGLITLGFVQLTRDYMDDKQAYAAAEHMKIIHDGAYEFVMDNFTTYLGGAVGSSVIVPFNTIRANGHIPAHIGQVNSFGRTVQVVAITTNLTPNIITLVCITIGRPIPEERVMAAAEYLGGYGGIWSAIDRDLTAGTSVGNIVGTFGMWSVPQLPITNALGGTITAPTVATGAHLATYNFINFDDELGDYLYRVNVAGASEANRMAVNIDMSNNDLRGIDNLNATGNMTLNDVADFRGFSYTGGSLNVTNNVTATGNMRSIAGAGMNARGGNAVIDVQNDVTANQLLLGNAGGAATMNATTGTITNASVNTATANTVEVSNIIATGGSSILATNAVVNNMTTTTANGRVEVGEITGASIVVTGSADTQAMDGAGNFSASDTDAEGVVTLGTVRFAPGATFTCNNGC